MRIEQLGRLHCRAGTRSGHSALAMRDAAGIDYRVIIGIEIG